MPATPGSRHAPLGAVDAVDADGIARPTVPVRPTPPPPSGEPWFHTVVAGETLEQLAHRYLGSSAAWWVMADANPTVFPLDLPPGTRLRVPRSGRPTAATRTRRF